MNFGDYFRQKRLVNKLTLRGFCERYGQDPAYISRLENSKIAPPKDEKKLSALAQTLQLEKQTKEWITFFDLAYQANNDLPQEIKESAPEVLTLLPAFLRTADNKKISKKKVEELIHFLKQ